jgi:hypothetical protein
MESKEAHLVLNQLQRAKEEVNRLDAEYRKICECNKKILGVKFDEKSFQKVYKTCRYHEVKFYQNIEPHHYAKV